jgi:hypothetical protein
MTVEPRRRYPQTNAGRDLMDWFGGPMRDEDPLRGYIRAIESEARTAALREVAEKVRAIFTSRGWAIYMDDRPDQPLDAWAALGDAILTEATGASE